MNISCTGTSTTTDSASPLTHKQLAGGKFYGSAYFGHWSLTCASGFEGISMAKYIRIIDDNDEQAFMKDGLIYFLTMAYGEASTPTAGADIDSVSIFNHVRLVPPSSFTIPTP